MKYIANIITACRIVCSVLLLLFPVFSPAYYSLYLLAGFSDMIDGVIARKTNSVSEFGSKLDTIADSVLFAVCLVKLLPALTIPTYILIWMGVIAVIKIINVISGYIVQKRFPAEHTVLNKLAGVMLFILPLTIPYVDVRYSGSIICVIATVAAIQEGHLMRTKKP